MKDTERARQRKRERQRGLTMMYKSSGILFHHVIKTNEGHYRSVVGKPLSFQCIKKEFL